MSYTHNATHGKCGKTWRQRGNTTGHCGGCHETFEGEHLFDAHRIYLDAEKTVRGCQIPQEMNYPKGWPLKSVNGSWRSSKPHPRSLEESE